MSVASSSVNIIGGIKTLKVKWADIIISEMCLNFEWKHINNTNIHKSTF